VQQSLQRPAKMYASNFTLNISIHNQHPTANMNYYYIIWGYSLHPSTNEHYTQQTKEEKHQHTSTMDVIVMKCTDFTHL
jgi:hypothetical protein